jgi:hypothetical protein
VTAAVGLGSAVVEFDLESGGNVNQATDQDAFPILPPDDAAQVYLSALRRMGASDQVINTLRDQLSASGAPAA